MHGVLYPFCVAEQHKAEIYAWGVRLHRANVPICQTGLGLNLAHVSRLDYYTSQSDYCSVDSNLVFQFRPSD